MVYLYWIIADVTLCTGKITDASSVCLPITEFAVNNISFFYTDHKLLGF